MLWRFWLSVFIRFYLLLSVLHRGHRYKTTPKTVIFWRLAPILVIFGPKCLRFGGPQHFNTLDVWPAFVFGPYLKPFPNRCTAQQLVQLVTIVCVNICRMCIGPYPTEKCTHFIHAMAWATNWDQMFMYQRTRINGANTWHGYAIGF